MSKKDFVIGLDIGATKICCAVGEVASESADIAKVVGLGIVPFSGVRKGVVVDADATVQAMSKAFEQARSMVIARGLVLSPTTPIVTGAVASSQRIVNCAYEAGVNFTDFCLESIASAEAVLTSEQKETGVVLVDIGGSTCDLVIYKNGVIVHTAVLGIGGNHITYDVSVGLDVSFEEAELIKVTQGIAIPSALGRETHKFLDRIIACRVEEILYYIHREVTTSGFNSTLGGTIVITGGTTLMRGMPELAQMIFDLPVKLGLPVNGVMLPETCNSPRYSTAIGFIKYGARNIQKSKSLVQEQKNIYDKVRGSMRTWIKDLF